MSENNDKTIYEKMVDIQAKIKVDKDNPNDYGKFYYRSCEDIIEAVKPLLKENDLVLNISDDILLLNERIYIQATAKVIDSKGNFIEAKGYARESVEKTKMDDAQLTGSASSYARKYALNGLFSINGKKGSYDEFNNQNSNNKQQNHNYVQVNDNQIAEVLDNCKKYSIDITKILQSYKIDSLKKLSINQYKKVMKRFLEIEKERKRGDKK